jgi:hypothetical protein
VGFGDVDHTIKVLTNFEVYVTGYYSIVGAKEKKMAQVEV